MENARKCIDCGTPHTTGKQRCPACHGVLEFNRHRLQSMAGSEFFSEKIFQRVYGVEFGRE